MPAPTENILVRGLNWLGDAVMSTPALIRLRQARPRARITLLSPEKLGGLWARQPFVDQVLTFSSSENPWQIGRRLRKESFTAGLIFPNSIRSALELWLAGVPERAGAARAGRSLLLTMAVPPLPGATPMRKRPPGEIRRRWPWLGSHRPGFKRGAWTNRNRMRQGERMRRHMSALSRKEYPMEAAPLQAHEPPKLSPATLTIT